MTRNKYIYHHYLDNKEVEKSVFLDALCPHFMKCDNKNDNPLLNISYLDIKALKRAYNSMLKPKSMGIIYVNDNAHGNCFRIVRETVK